MTSYLNPNQKKIKDALIIHKNDLVPFIKTRVSQCSINEIKVWFNDANIEKILTNLPNELVTINNRFFSELPNYELIEYNSYLSDIRKRNLTIDQRSIRDKYSRLREELEKIFDYNNYFSSKTSPYSTYDLANNLDIPTCPYCNRMYTKTVITKQKNSLVQKITRPEFDHWFPKSKFPLLALSFFNLIPSCHTCNSSVKGNSDFVLSTHLHPYLDEKINMQFSYEFDKNLNNHKFKINYSGDTNGKAQKSAEEFLLKEIYETHEDEIKDLLRIKNAYSDAYLQKLSNLLGTSVSDEEVYRLAFGTYIQEASFDRRPLSRMKRDILKELGIIKPKNL